MNQFFRITPSAVCQKDADGNCLIAAIPASINGQLTAKESSKE